MTTRLATTGLIMLLAGCSPAESRIENAPDEPQVEVAADPAAQRVDVRADGELFTSYVYSDTLTVLKKPVLFPIRTAEGVDVSRGYPIDPKPGERVDHPHHIGLWLNYGDVNGLDFWNNSDAVSAERRDEMGTIRHADVESTESGAGAGELVVSAQWLAPNGEALLDERTRFVFRAGPDVRIIDRITRLTAGDRPVSFEDNKEGMLGLRVTRALEMPAGGPVDVVGPDGEVVETTSNEGVTGRYRNSEGVSGYPDVWGKRARWMTLTGVVEGDSVAVAILDHPSNVGHPTYWHARDYGLFAANPLGQSEFSEGAEHLGFALDAGESTTFRFRVVVYSGEASTTDVEAWYEEFTAANLNAASAN